MHNMDTRAVNKMCSPRKLKGIKVRSRLDSKTKDTSSHTEQYAAHPSNPECPSKNGLTRLSPQVLTCTLLIAAILSFFVGTSLRSRHKVIFHQDTTPAYHAIHLDPYKTSHHEALVHPSMFSHPNPKRVAIVEGGEGATLQEVLKHKTVEEVLMVGIDEHIPEWYDCSDIEGCDADACLDDSRAYFVNSDALSWFVGNFHEDESKEDRFDVIIMANDGNIYKNNSFIESLYNALSDDGVVSFLEQIGI